MDRARDLVEVTLVDVDADHDPEPAPPARRRVSRRFAIGAVVALTLAVAAATVVEQADDRARAARLADIEGIMRGLDQAPVETWRADGTGVVAQVGGVLVVTDLDGSSVSGIDAATGRALWTRGPDEGGRFGHGCSPLEAEPFALDFTTYPGSGGLNFTGWWPTAETGPLVCASEQDQGAGQVTTSAALVDPVSGQELVAWSVPGTLIMQEVRDGDVVMVVNDGADVVAARLGPEAGALTWQTVMPDVIGDSDGWGAWADHDSGLLVVTGERTAGVDMDTGQQIDDPDPEDYFDEFDRPRPVWHLPDGGTLEWTPDPSREFPGGQGFVADADGQQRFELPGAPVVPAVSDGSHRDILIAQSAPLTVAGLDASTGEVLWTTDARPATGVVQMDGILVLNDSERVRAIDVTTGRERWATEPRTSAVQPALSDGNVVLTDERLDGDQVLVARRITDGKIAWTARTPDSAYSVTRLGPTALLVIGSHELARLDIPIEG